MTDKIKCTTHHHSCLCREEKLAHIREMIYAAESGFQKVDDEYFENETIRKLWRMISESAKIMRILYNGQFQSQK